ncbi:MAG: glycosyl hydrolase family 8 [Longimicrobiales bacterium]|nr:glycosyl hydrolase family 8 [Longimicrobiales bacterium]
MSRAWAFTVSVLAALVLAVGIATCRFPGVSRAEFLDRSWDRYLELYLADEGYVLDPRRNGGNGGVTSEGQGYALLRAVWEDDPGTFDRVFRWTETHLKRDDGLYAWLWSPEGGPGGGETAEGRVVDANTATDADQEIAWALSLAADAFQRPEYRDRAREIVRAVRIHTGIDLPGGWFPSAGNWAVAERIVNPSYFVPYAYGAFHALDPEGGWDRMADRGYDLLEAILEPSDVRLVPDFTSLDSGGRPRPLPEGTGLSTDFSFDAVRIFWRVEADCVLTGRPRACADPLNVSEVAPRLPVHGWIVSRYALDAEPLTDEVSTSFYGAVLPAFRRHAPEVAETVVEPGLEGRTLSELMEAEMRYYDHNWVWFGLALDRGVITDWASG